MMISRRLIKNSFAYFNKKSKNLEEASGAFIFSSRIKNLESVSLRDNYTLFDKSVKIYKNNLFIISIHIPSLKYIKNEYILGLGRKCILDYKNTIDSLQLPEVFSFEEILDKHNKAKSYNYNPSYIYILFK